MSDSIDNTTIVDSTTTLGQIPPIVPLNTWTWNTPVIPTFYWNVYSAEQRIRQICLEIGRIQAYLDYLGAYANRAHMELNQRIDLLTAKLTEEVERLDKRIDDENAARKEADELLQTGLDAEVARAKAAEAVLQSNIDSTNVKVDAETIRAKAAEEQNANAIALETDNRVKADKVLESAVETETNRAETAERLLQSNIDTNKNSSDESDKRIQDSLDTEIANRKNGDIALGERVDIESATRQQAVSTLTADVNERLKPTNVKIADDAHLTATITSSTTDPNGTTLTLGDTWAGDFEELETKITDLEGKLTHETHDRETADDKLTTDVNARLKAESVIAGTNITVVPDPDSTTVTVSTNNVPTFDEMAETVQEESDARERADTAIINTLNTKMSKVIRDDTLKGSGTTSDPLGVNLNHATVMNDNGKTVYPTLMKANDTDTINGIGFNAGNGLSAYNSDDTDTGSGIKLSDDTMTSINKADTALQTVSHDTSFTGDGTVDSPLKLYLRNDIYPAGESIGAYLFKDLEFGYLGIPTATSTRGEPTAGVVNIHSEGEMDLSKYPISYKTEVFDPTGPRYKWVHWSGTMPRETTTTYTPYLDYHDITGGVYDGWRSVVVRNANAKNTFAHRVESIVNANGETTTFTENIGVVILGVSTDSTTLMIAFNPAYVGIDGDTITSVTTTSINIVTID